MYVQISTIVLSSLSAAPTTHKLKRYVIWARALTNSSVREYYGRFRWGMQTKQNDVYCLT